MSTVLVTGGSGFIGSAIVRLLARTGHDVLVPHRSAETPPRLVNVASEAKLIPSVDLADGEAMDRIVRGARPAWIVHAAAAGVRSGSAEPQAMTAVNVGGTVGVIDAAARYHADRVILLGSGFEYEPSDGPLGEDAPSSPTTLYGATKAASSVIARFYREIVGVDVTVARLFSVYGPREAVCRFVPHLVTRALDNMSIEMSAGNQVRDYLFVDEAAEAVLRLLQLGERPPLVVNVVGPERQTLRDVAETVVELAGSQSTVHLGAKEPHSADRVTFIGDGGRLDAVLGWHPARDLRSGLCETIAWYRENRRLWKTM